MKENHARGDAEVAEKNSSAAPREISMGKQDFTWVARFRGP